MLALIYKTTQARNGARLNMPNSIPAYIRSYSIGSRRAISDLITSAQREKRSLGALSASLASMSNTSPFTDGSVRPLQLSSLSSIIDFFRDVGIKTREYYQAVNTIDYTLNSSVIALSSEISKLEKTIKELEVFIDKYGFLSGEDDLFNGSFVETFSDSSNIYLNDSIAMQPVDRDGQTFLNNEVGIIDVSNGSLKAGSSLIEYKQRPIVSYYVNNFSQYVSSSSDILNMFSEQSSKSWSVTVKSPSILRSKIQDIHTDLGYNVNPETISGANCSFVLDFPNPSSINCIRISPNMGKELQLLQVILYRSSQKNIQSSPDNSLRNKTIVLNAPIYIDSVKDISFEEQLVGSIKFIFNQPVYKRIINTASPQELQVKAVNDYIASMRKKRNEKHDKLQDVVYSFFLKRNQIAYLNADAGYIPDYYTYRYPCEDTEPNYGALSEFLHNSKSFSKMDIKNKFSNSSKLTIMVESIVSYVLGERFRMTPTAYLAAKGAENPMAMKDIDHNAHYHVGPFQQPFKSNRQDQENITAVSDRFDMQRQDFDIDKVGYYEYSFSIKSIKMILISNDSTKNVVAPTVGNGINQSKTFYISKRIDSDGHISKVKMMSDFYIPQLSDLSLDLRDACTIEFSVSNKNTPNNDSDWVSILPNRIQQSPGRDAIS